MLLTPLQRRDATLALVGATSWAAVAWKLSRGGAADGGAVTEGLLALVRRRALLALAVALLCLWPIALGVTAGLSYPRWREFLVPAHLALQHWIGLRFTLPSQAQPLLASPEWARHLLPVFLATFCQPWLYLAFGACLQRTRLRTFLWTQPVLLAPVLWAARPHCAQQLTARPEAAGHLRHIASAMQLCGSWLPVGPVAAPADGSLPDAEGACLAVHSWLVLLLAYGLPAIIIHRLEGQEEPALQPVPKPQQGPGPTAQRDGTQRDLLLQHRPTLLASAAELALAAYSAWLLVHACLPLTGMLAAATAVA